MNNDDSILHSFPVDIINYEFDSIDKKEFNYFNGVRPLFLIKNENSLKISYNYYSAINVGHPNIDNNAEFFALNG